MVFSQRTGWPSEPNAIVRAVDEMRASGRGLSDLTVSNPTVCGLEYPGERILRALTDERGLLYDPHPQGMLAAREAVCRYYLAQGRAVSSDQVFLTASTSEAYSFVFRLLADPGDEILFPRPSYPLFDCLAGLNDVAARSYPLIYAEGAWRLDREALSDLVSERTRAVVLVQPNNPTGSLLSADDYFFLRETCARYHVPIISDEVFLDYFFDPSSPQGSLAGQREVLTFVLGGLSKALALPQMKVSWIIVSGPEAEAREAVRRLEIVADAYLSVNTPVQYALPSLLGMKGEIQTQVRARVEENRAVLMGLDPDDAVCLGADGGWNAVVEIKTACDEETFVLDLVRERGAYVYPGYFFDFDTGPIVVVSLLPRPEVFASGIRELVALIRERR